MAQNPTDLLSSEQVFVAGEDSSQRIPSCPLVTIVVPAYNDAAYLPRALDSCLAQTYANLQIICVNDGSTDNTFEIIASYAQKDSRIVPLNLSKNGGTHNARLTALEHAQGKLISFLDGDDEILPDFIQCGVNEYERKPYDVLHFATRALSDNKVTQQRVSLIETWTCPVEGELYGRAILEESFVAHSYSYSVACKMYPTSLVKRAFLAIGPMFSDAGEDGLEYFAIAFFAKLYRGLPNHQYYLYHLGDGGSEHENVSLKDFARDLRGRDSVEGIKRFLISQNAFDEYGSIYEFHWNDQLQVVLRNWYNDVCVADKLACLERIFEVWPKESAINYLCEFGSDAMGYVCELVGPDYKFSPRQMWAWGFAQGKKLKELEYEESFSYRLGRTLTALPRVIKTKLGKQE